MDEFETITIIDEDGNEIDKVLILSYTNDQVGKEYLLFGDEEPSDDSEFYVYSKDIDGDELYEIIDDQEYDEVIETFDTLIETLGQG